MRPIYRLSVVRERTGDYEARQTMRTSAEVEALLCPYFAPLDRETFVVVPLDGKNKPLGFHVVSVGTLTASLVHPREVFKIALLENAAAIVLAHNHPSGDPTPSTEDITITSRLVQAGELLGVRILDHVIVGEGRRYYSFVDHDALPSNERGWVWTGNSVWS
jgi:DNA repair protein RadC